MPGEVTEFDVEIRPYGILLKPGYRLALRLKCADDEKPQHDLQWIATGPSAAGRSPRLSPSIIPRISVHLLLPITRGNRIGTYMSGACSAKADEVRLQRSQEAPNELNLKGRMP